MGEQSYLDFIAQLGVSSAHPGGFILTKAILDREDISKDSNILDVGCGTGRTSEYIANTYHCRVTALDNHPIMLEKAKARFKKSGHSITLIDGNVEKLPFPDETFDLVIAESVTAFTHIPVSLKEYNRVLKEDGLLIEVEMTSEQPLTSHAKSEIKQLYDIKQVLTEEDWYNVLRDAHFDNIQSFKGTDFDKLTAMPEANIDVSNFMVSEGFNLDTFQIWLNHVSLMRKYQNVLQYRVYRALKKRT